MIKHKSISIPLIPILLLFGLLASSCENDGSQGTQIPDEILNIMGKPRYSEATWALRVVDLESGELIYDLNPELLAFTGSVRKLFSVGLALNELGADHRFTTPVHRQGQVDAQGVLNGDLILVANGDLTLGGRRTPEDTIAFTNFDHTEANSLGSAILTKPDPLAGLNGLAKQVADAGITRVEGDIVIDDRLFDKFRVPNGNVLITPIVVNDNLIDVTITPTEPGEPALVDWRPKTATFEIQANVMTVAEGEEETVELSEISSDNPGVGIVEGNIPVGFTPPLTGILPLVQTFRIEDPSSFARTAFIEALERAGVTVTATTVGPNHSEKLPPEGSYTPDTLVAELVSLPYSEYSKLILKVSHNLGANLSLMLFGLARGVRNIDDALLEERKTLIEEFGINGDEFNFPTNGSGSPDSQAAPKATVKLLRAMREKEVFIPYFDSLPILGVDGSLATVEVDIPAATGNVFAKTGTTILEGFFRAQVLAGYIDAKSGKRLAYALYVNDIGNINSINDVVDVFTDEGNISAIIFELN